jgi:phage FluMu protein Com
MYRVYDLRCSRCNHIDNDILVEVDSQGCLETISCPECATPMERIFTTMNFKFAPGFFAGMGWSRNVTLTHTDKAGKVTETDLTHRINPDDYKPSQEY